MQSIKYLQYYIQAMYCMTDTLMFKKWNYFIGQTSTINTSAITLYIINQ